MEPEVTHQAIMDRLKAGDARFARIEEQMRRGMPRLDAIEAQMDHLPAMSEKVDAIYSHHEKTCEVLGRVESLLELQATAMAVGRFANAMRKGVLWVAGLVIAIGGAFAVLKGWIRGAVL